MYNKIVKLEWDSEFFNLEVGKLIIQNSIPSNFLKELSKFQLVYIFSENKISEIDDLLVDKKTILTLKLDDSKEFKVKETNGIIEPFDIKKHDTSTLIDLAIQSGIYSRFNLDPNIDDLLFKKLYRKWILNSIDKVNALQTLVFSFENKVVALLTISIENESTASIGLFAVDSNYRGLGIGINMINQAINYVKEQGYDRLNVVTQLDNNSAINIYKKAGFNIINLTYIYHYWNL
ncbi:hypothetical protein GCM10027429_02430 [Marivirga atlantica]|jgi:dTDP-4-amino-4,6-dideoxy-D-galactose acyltransferase|uniref:GNAT family N-acetyltransferase n=1 Tax=Marivirga atlantica TaxID=1548457 RepID=A0A937A5A2_9BACT|nr:GNAT family N-acetyltransferase [Marivirga atlantica]MBL0763855.1 GNAT family N-acetyltransferase [Marivirga atlantica]